jgi:hypothetical protein
LSAGAMRATVGLTISESGRAAPWQWYWEEDAAEYVCRQQQSQQHFENSGKFYVLPVARALWRHLDELCKLLRSIGHSAIDEVPRPKS